MIGQTHTDRHTEIATYKDRLYNTGGKWRILKKTFKATISTNKKGSGGGGFKNLVL